LAQIVIIAGMAYGLSHVEIGLQTLFMGTRHRGELDRSVGRLCLE
jgi:hypothetical protein